MGKVKAAGPVTCLLAGEGAGLAALHRLGAEPFMQVPWRDLGGWLQSADPVDALASVLRLAALGLAWWLTGTTVVAVVVRAAGGSRSFLDRLTFPFVRRMADRLGGMAVTAALLTSPGGAAWTAMQPTSAVAQATEQGWDVPGLPPMPVWPQPVPAAPQPGPPLVPAVPETATVVLVQGDNLWSVAKRQLAAATGRDPVSVPVPEIHAYWMALIAENRDSIRSGNPDLVYPGERLTLPDPSAGR